MKYINSLSILRYLYAIIYMALFAACSTNASGNKKDIAAESDAYHAAIVKKEETGKKCMA